MKGNNAKRSVRECIRLALERIPDPTLSRKLRDGVALYREFNRFTPAHVITIHHPRVVPPVTVELGELVGLIYRSDKGMPGSPKNYIHFMENPPRLASNVEGTQLYIVGGGYRVTRRGIEG